MAWFYLHCTVAVIVLITDAKGTFEPFMKKWEKKLGIPVPEEVVKEEIKRYASDNNRQI